ncbi:caspase domain-containing protein [Mycotypha africana]|uniref:caspase domain-containing protein n=1 Tax=Mycotypha africana TaxID=64632 RepID=UPI0023007C15|nr:caspase domain-containing protein [Mycotypha africana]KAI8984660.1 caspase domain-containing protein [Mycotypha africana]
MQFPGQGYTLNGGGYPPPQQQGYPPLHPSQQYNQGYPPPPQPYPGYPPPSSQPPPYQGYPPYTYNSQPPPSTSSMYPPPLPANHPHSNNHHSIPPPLPSRESLPPPPPPTRPPASPLDPPFSPNDPTLGQANYHQPPHSIYNPSPAPVLHIPPPPNVNPNDFVLHVNPKFRNIPPPQFQLSNCQGRKRALLIGINYFHTRNELRGCINDVHNVKHFLITVYNFREEDMIILTDDQVHDARHMPTKQNMIQAMQWLVHDSRPNDSFFFHFSGHGGRMRDYDGDEDDGYDETIYPVDHEVYGQIVDDMMNDIMVRPLAPGCRLTAIFDSCHSGTALDLPYVYSTQGAVKESNLFKETGSSLLNAGLAYMSGNPMKAVSSMMSIGSNLVNGGGLSKQKKERVKQQKGSAADVIMLSGCKDNQTSADAQEAGRATGAMSWAFTTALRQNRNQSYLQLLNSIRQLLKQKYQQRPQLSSSHPMDMNLLFMI